MKPSRKALIARDRICVINLPGCSGWAETLDHRANRGSGGSKVLNAPYCLVGSCVRCNGLKEDADGDTRADLIRRGVRVQKRATNQQTAERCRDTPVLFPDGSWWRLLEDGTKELVRAADAFQFMELIQVRGQK